MRTTLTRLSLKQQLTIGIELATGKPIEVRSTLRWLIAAAFLWLALPINGGWATDIVFAGVSFTGDYDQRAARYPYAAELSSRRLPSGQSLLDAELRKTLDSAYSGPLNLLDSGINAASGDNLALAFGITAEGIEEVKWGQGYLYIYRVMASVLVFDFERNLLIANYPAIVQFQDGSRQKRASKDHLAIFETIYSAKQPERSIMHEWVARLNTAEIKQSFPRYLGVRSVELADGVPEQLPDRQTPDAYATVVAQVFEALLSKQQNVAMVPYTTGQAVGQAMPLSFQDATMFQLTLPEPNFVFDLTITPFRHAEKKKGRSAQHAFGAFFNLDFSLAATGKTYLSTRFKQVNQAVFNEKDKVNVDVWQSQQTALRGLMNSVAQQISARDPAKLSKITKDNIVDELKTTEEKIALCR